MNTDSHFQIGSSHIVCEDYALSGVIKADDNTNYYYGVVADGCSSASHADIGARILALEARKVIEMTVRNRVDVVANIQAEVDSIALSIITNSLYTAQLLGASRDCLFSTLWFFITHDKQGNDQYPRNLWSVVVGWGDGILAIRDDDSFRVVQREYASGAPYYLLYWIDAEKRAGYCKEYALDVSDTTWNNGIAVGVESVRWNAPFVFFTTHQPDTFQSLSILSDGFGSFSNPNSTIISEFGDEGRMLWATGLATQIKNPVGEFQVRRFRRMESEMSASGTSHYDDISCATVAKGVGE